MSVDTRSTSLAWTLLYILIPVSILTILSLLAALYSIALLVKVDGLWSLWIWLLFYYFFRRENHLWAIPRATIIYCMDTWRNSIGYAFGRGCRFVFHVHPIFICLSSSSLLISLLIQRENLLLQEPCSRHLSTLFTRSLRLSLLPETVYLVSLLSFSSINFLYFSW